MTFKKGCVPWNKGKLNPTRKLLNLIDNPAKRPEVKKKIGKAQKGRKHSREENEKRSKSMKKRWKDPSSIFNGKKFLKKRAEKLIGKPKSEEHKKKISKTRKRLFAEGKIKAYWKGKRLPRKTIEKISKAKSKPYEEIMGKEKAKETKLKKSIFMKKVWIGTKKTFKKRCKHCKKIFYTTKYHSFQEFCSRKCSVEAYRIHRKEKGKKGKYNSKAIKKFRECQTGRVHTWRERKKRSKSLKKRWREDKDYRENQLKLQRIGMKKRPNKPEKKIIKLIKENNLPFEYTGNKTFSIRGFNPDFKHKRKKKLIELFGDYWHSPNNPRRTDKKKIKSYKLEGYGVLIIYERELKKLDKVLKRINKFNSQEREIL